MLYCNIALDEGSELARAGAAEPTWTASRRHRDGLDAQVAGRSLADWASDLGAIAERGLKACLPDDLDKISPLLERIEDGRSPADDLLDAWNTDPSPEHIIAACAY